jgi:hypothetical protein
MAAKLVITFYSIASEEYQIEKLNIEKTMDVGSQNGTGKEM